MEFNAELPRRILARTERWPARIRAIRRRGIHFRRPRRYRTSILRVSARRLAPCNSSVVLKHPRVLRTVQPTTTMNVPLGTLLRNESDIREPPELLTWMPCAPKTLGVHTIKTLRCCCKVQPSRCPNTRMRMIPGCYSPSHDVQNLPHV